MNSSGALDPSNREKEEDEGEEEEGGQGGAQSINTERGNQ